MIGCAATLVMGVVAVASVRSAEMSYQAAVPTACTSRSPFVMVPPFAVSLAFHSAKVEPPARRAIPAAPAMTPLVLFFMVVPFSYGGHSGRAWPA